MKRRVDLRSDTLTKPSEGMRRRMYEAEVGDDVYGEDVTVNKLQDICAELFGKEGALFVPSGVMGNQICINIMTRPGDEIICDEESHIYNFESGSPSKISGVQIVTTNGERGMMDPAEIENKIRPKEAYYMPRTSLICMENTHNMRGGVIIPIENISAVKEAADKHGLRMHLDGARLWNAHIVSGISLSKYAEYFDTLMCSVSKGLGAPIGSIIAGSKEFIKEGVRVRKALGGGMRQAGVIAAAAIYAIENNIPLLGNDHKNAKEIANALIETGKFFVEPVETNIIMFKPKEGSSEKVLKIFAERGIKVSIVWRGLIRGITHMDLTGEDISYVITTIKKEFDGEKSFS
jgi:threonine aldolase